MPEGFQVSQDGTHFIPVAPAPTSSNQPIDGGSNVQAQDVNAMRQQLGLPVQQETPAQPQLEPGKKYTISELIAQGVLDPEARHDLTQLTSYQTTVSNLQRQQAERDRQVQANLQRQADALREQREEQDFQRRLAQMAPHERINAERQFYQYRIEQSRQREAQTLQQQNDANELRNWEAHWQSAENIPAEVISTLNQIADQNRLFDPAVRYEFMNAGTRRYIADRANGRLPTSESPVQPGQSANHTQFNQQGQVQNPGFFNRNQPQQTQAPYTPVVTPTGTQAGGVPLNQHIANAMTSMGTSQEDEVWRKLYAELRIPIR